MRRWGALMIVALLGFALLPEPSGAFGRRRCRPSGCNCVVSCCTSMCAPCGAAPMMGSAPSEATAVAQHAKLLMIRGRQHQIVALTDSGENDFDEVEHSGGGVASSDLGISGDDIFKGTARRVAKTIIYSGAAKPFHSVAEIFANQLQSNDEMKDLRIGKGPSVGRVTQEQFNVKVEAFIYAFRKESDNDYHVILGDAPGTPNPWYLNAEVSGIPSGGSDANRQQLQTVRKLFKDTFEVGSTGPVSYHRVNPPVPVTVTGSLFWDPEHEPPNTVGPGFAKPGSAWEIHPISNLVFRD
jgi:hypothetical protein